MRLNRARLFIWQKISRKFVPFSARMILTRLTAAKQPTYPRLSRLKVGDSLRISDLWLPCTNRGRSRMGAERKLKQERGGKNNTQSVSSPVCEGTKLARGCVPLVHVAVFASLQPDLYTAKGLTDRVSPAIVITHIEGVTPTKEGVGEGERRWPVTSNSPRTRAHSFKHRCVDKLLLDAASPPPFSLPRSLFGLFFLLS